MYIPIEISAKHIHLCQRDLDKLFGRGYKLKKLRNLTLPKEYACKEVLDIKIEKKVLERVRVVGPVRENTQAEISMTDAVKLGINPPINESGDLRNSVGAILIGPKGKVKIKKGVIVAWRHIHCNSKEAEKLGIRNKQLISVEVKGKRAITFHNIIVRIKDNYKLSMHLDTDEGNAGGINKKTKGILLK
ncbi:MAG: phosphate propanoyltransferase [Candidatus Nealsonbacteria bacterium]